MMYDHRLLLEILFMLYYRVVTCSYKQVETLASMIQVCQTHCISNHLPLLTRNDAYCTGTQFR